MPNRYVVTATDFAMNPHVRAAGARAGWAWFLIASHATAFMPSAPGGEGAGANDARPRLTGAARWKPAAWRCLGVSRRLVEEAVAHGLLRWEGEDLVVLGMATHHDRADCDLGPVNPAAIGHQGLSEAAKAQRRAAAQARWRRDPAEPAGYGSPRAAPADAAPHAEPMRTDAESDAEPDAEPDAESMRAASSDMTGLEKRDGKRDDARACAHAEDHAEPDAGRIDSASGSASLSASGIRTGPPPTARPRPPAKPRPLPAIPAAIQRTAMAPTPATETTWTEAQRSSWLTAMRDAGCKVGPQNWAQWKRLTIEWDLPFILLLIGSVPATERWPDRVEDALRATHRQTPVHLIAENRMAIDAARRAAAAAAAAAPAAEAAHAGG